MSGKLLRCFGIAQRSNSSSKAASRRRRCSLEPLETRELMDASGVAALVHNPWRDDLAREVEYSMADYSTASAGKGSILTVSSTTTSRLTTKMLDQRTSDQLMGLPFLDSLPGAPVTLYLDFNGHSDPNWWYYDDNHVRQYRNTFTPVFDTDGNTNVYSASEQSLIRDVWARVSEDFAPFNINVSTDYYGTFNDGQALRVAIGGNDTDWLVTPGSGVTSASGISVIGSFSNGDAANTVFVFDLTKWASAGITDGDGRFLNGAAAIATTASHEAGHSFGLRHQALYRFDGSKINDYSPGSSGWTPIMGDNLASDRTTWAYGTTDNGLTQSDLDILAAKLGYKPDDVGNSTATATTLYASSQANNLTGSGLIGTMNDWDFFKFTTSSPQFTVTVNAAPIGPNLIPVAELWSATGRYIMSANAGSLTQSVIRASLPAGTYYVSVMGYVDYGDLGRYTVSVAIDSLTVVIDTISTMTASTTTTTTSTTSPITKEPTLTKSSSLGSPGNLATIDAQVYEAEPAALPKKPASRSSTKTEGRKTTYELHDDVFGRNEFADEVAAWLS